MHAKRRTNEALLSTQTSVEEITRDTKDFHGINIIGGQNLKYYQGDELMATAGYKYSSGLDWYYIDGQENPIAITTGGNISIYSDGVGGQVGLSALSSTGQVGLTSLGTILLSAGTGYKLLSGGPIEIGFRSIITNNTLPILKSSDESVTSSETLQNDDTLKLAILASSKWELDFYVVVYCADASVDFKFDVTAPASATIYYGFVGEAAGFLVGSADWFTTSSALSVDIVAGEYKIVHIKAIVLNSTNAGDIQLRWAQNSSSGTAMTVKAGSYVKGWRLG